MVGFLLWWSQGNMQYDSANRGRKPVCVWTHLVSPALLIMVQVSDPGSPTPITLSHRISSYKAPMTLENNVLRDLQRQTIFKPQHWVKQGNRHCVFILRTLSENWDSPMETSQCIKLEALWFSFCFALFSNRSFLQETLHIWSVI